MKSFQIAPAVFTGGMTDPLNGQLRSLSKGKITPPKPSPIHVCQAFANEAVRFLKEPKNNPFLCYVPLDAPHDPHIVPADFPVRR